MQRNSSAIAFFNQSGENTTAVPCTAPVRTAQLHCIAYIRHRVCQQGLDCTIHDKKNTHAACQTCQICIVHGLLTGASGINTSLLSAAKGLRSSEHTAKAGLPTPLYHCDRGHLATPRDKVYSMKRCTVDRFDRRRFSQNRFRTGLAVNNANRDQCSGVGVSYGGSLFSV